MNLKFFKISVFGLVLSLSSIANASLITTTFSGNNAFAGNMFDVTIFNNDLLLSAADINLGAQGSNALISVYTRIGGFSGFELDAAAWTLQGQQTVTSSGSGNPTVFNFADFILSANTQYGMYFSVTDYATDGQIKMKYTTGTSSYSNSDLKLDLGIGRGNGDFTGDVFNPRSWNGTLYYNAVDVTSPSTFLLFTAGAMLLVARRYKK
jgi:hypothetical protein